MQTPIQPVEVDAARREVPTGIQVEAGQTWVFEAEGTWTDWFVACGPDGYDNPIADFLDIRPRAPDSRWFCLMGVIDGDPHSVFRIGGRARQTFLRAGGLSVFANDLASMYWNNHGRVTLRAALEPPGGTPGAALAIKAVATAAVVAEAAPRRRLSSLARAWAECVETFDKTRGLGFIALLVLLTGWILTGTPPGQDLVTTVAEDAGFGRGLGLGLMVTWFAAQAWFWSRMIVVYNYGADRERWSPRWLLVWAPRMLGLAPFVFVIPALLLVHTPAAAAAAAVGVFGVGFLVFLIEREDIGRALVARGPRRFAETLRDRPGLFRRRWIVFSYAVAIVSWVVATLWPVAPSQALGPASTVFLGLACIIPFTITLIHVGRVMRLPIMGALLVLAAGFTVLPSSCADNHVVGRRAFHADQRLVVAGKSDLAQAYAAWKAQAPVPHGAHLIVFVSSEGGASRAGYWTAEVLATLQDLTRGQFSKDTFAITSVSGGSVGAAGFLASIDDRRPQRDSDWAALKPFVGKDFLSPALAGMLFPDLVQRFLPISVLPDRGEALERSWEAAWRDNCSHAGPYCEDAGAMSAPFLSLWRKPGTWRPALVIEGASEETGRRILTSNLDVEPPAGASSFTDADDFHIRSGRDVALSTAILNGARYPWVSPAGTLTDPGGGEQGHIVDGGYFDASGTETTRELARAVLRQAKGDQLTPVFLVIGNCADSPGGAPNPTKRLLADAIAPFYGLYASRDGHQAHLNAALRADVAQGPPANSACPETIFAGEFEGVAAYYLPIKLCTLDGYTVPLDWVLSRKAQAVMDRAANGHATRRCRAADNLGWIADYLLNGSPRPLPGTVTPPGPKAGS